MEILTEETLTQALLNAVSTHCEDFAADQARCRAAANALKSELGEAAVEEELRAIHAQAVSASLFSGFLGFAANLEHFTDPVRRTFLEVDPEIYLRERTARTLPEYAAAQTAREQFRAALSPAQRERYEDIGAYASLLETAVPKLAHYWGYLLADRLLPRVLPGYTPDPMLTARYTKLLQEEGFLLKSSPPQLTNAQKWHHDS